VGWSGIRWATTKGEWRDRVGLQAGNAGNAGNNRALEANPLEIRAGGPYYYYYN
jgi:hypothetical protein